MVQTSVYAKTVVLFRFTIIPAVNANIPFHQSSQSVQSLLDSKAVSLISAVSASYSATCYGGSCHSHPHNHYCTSNLSHPYYMADQYKYSLPFLHKDIRAVAAHDNCPLQSMYAINYCPAHCTRYLSVSSMDRLALQILQLPLSQQCSILPSHLLKCIMLFHYL